MQRRASGADVDLGYSALSRRERAERIAAAERDRRAGRVDVAIATLGEPSEWAARVVLALARLPQDEGHATRRVLEEGLEDWAADLGLASLDEHVEPLASAAPAEDQGSTFESRTASLSEEESAENDSVAFESLAGPTLADVLDELDRPIDPFELDLAFAGAEAQVDEMHDVNAVAERVLLDEPLGLAEISDDPAPESEGLANLGDLEQFVDPALDPPEEAAFDPFRAGGLAEGGFAAEMDAASVPTRPGGSTASLDARAEVEAVRGPRTPRSVVLATLERWLRNLETNKRERVQ